MKRIIYTAWIFIEAVGRMILQELYNLCYGFVYPFKQIAKQIINEYGREGR